VKKKTSEKGLFEEPASEPAETVNHKGYVFSDEPGKFQMISKSVLRVDHDYQRDDLRRKRIDRIIREWSWVKFGVLLVALRKDGTRWVFDGQHRKLAADRRDDVDLLPCMVYQSEGKLEEAKYFLECQSDRSNVTALDTFKARLAQNDPVATAVDEMIRSSGYTISKSSGSKTVECVQALMDAVKQDADAAAFAWRLCVAIGENKSIHRDLFVGVFVVECHLKRRGLSLLGKPYGEKARSISPKSYLESIKASAGYHGAKNKKTIGEGIIKAINNRLRGVNKIPSIVEAANEDS
jgi:hypothetical protein